MAVTGISANRLELLQIADSVAREKNIEREIVIEAIEEAIQKGAKSRYGAHHDIRAKIDHKTGELMLTRHVTVVEDDWQPEDELEEFNDSAMVRLRDASKRDPEAEVGKEYVEVLPPFEFGRVQTQMARQVITGKVREAERDRQYEEFKDRTGTIINGIVKREEYGNIIVDVGRGEAILRRNEKIGRESYRPNDRIRAYVKDVRREARGPQIFLSRTHPQFMAKLFAQEVPEIYDGVIEIKAVARDPGSRAKIAVISYDNSIDPVGACVGMRGSRVQAVVGELQGEKIDIIPWSEDQATFLVNALQPAEVAKVVIDEVNGVIVMGEAVRVSTVAIAQGNLTVSVQETPQVIQPAPFSQGQTAVVPDTQVAVEEELGREMRIVRGGESLSTVVNGLNALGVSPRDMISILQAIKAAGALQADIEVM